MPTSYKQQILSRLDHLRDITRQVLASPSFFHAVVGLLVVQALWIALTARYPQAFDENYHLGLIRLHADKLLPFFTSQPPGSEVYGAILREPSYLYHYLMSFPYRLLEAFTSSLPVQVIALRLINIMLFVGGLFVYRNLLDRLGISVRMRNVVLLFFVLTPIMPLLAGHISYDNALLPLAGLMFIAGVRYLQTLSDTGSIDVRQAGLVLLYGMTASLVKYAFSPLLLALVVILVVLTVRAVMRSGVSRPALRIPGRMAFGLLALGLLVIGVLFVERYGINIVRYQTPVPDCAQVLTVEQCKQYSPWGRDHLFAATYPRPTNWGIFVYPGVWAHRMVFETMFTISSRFYPGSEVVRYVPASPLTVANYTAWTLTVAGFILLLYFIRRLWSMAALRVLLLVVSFYSLVLFIKNFAMYLHTGEAVAIHGRYLIPVFPVIYAALALVFAWAFDKLRRPIAKEWLFLITLLFLLQGAGIITWIIRSDPAWYWQESPVASRVNWVAKQALEPFIIH